MKAFRFRLERVFGVSRNRERLSKVRLFEAKRQVLAMKETLDRSEFVYRRETDRAKEEKGPIDSRELVHLGSRFKHLRMVLRRKGERLESAKEEEGTRWADLVKRRQNRRVLEKLREGRLAEHQREVLEEEQKVLDEMALERHISGAVYQGNMERR